MPLVKISNSVFSTVLLVFLLLFSCSDKPSKKAGDVAFVNKMCMGSDTEETYKLVDEISVKKDQPALMSLVAAGKVYIVPSATKGVIRDVAFGRYLVELEIGIETKRLWIAQEFIE